MTEPGFRCRPRTDSSPRLMCWRNTWFHHPGPGVDLLHTRPEWTAVLPAAKEETVSCSAPLMGHRPGKRVNHDNLPPQLPGIVDRCAGAAAPHSTENRQQQASRFHQPVVPVDHTAVIILAAHIVHRIGPFQNRMIPLPRWITPPVRLPSIGQDTAEFQRGIFLTEVKHDLRRPAVGSVRASGKILCHPGPGQRCDLPRQGFFQRYAPWVRLIVLPGKFMRTVASEGAGCTYHLKTSPFDGFSNILYCLWQTVNYKCRN